MLSNVSHKKAKSGNERGIMLVEMLVAFGIISVTFVVIVSAYLSSSRATQIAQRQAEVADAIAYALADMAREAQVSGEYGRDTSPAAITMERVAGIGGIAAGPVRYEKDGLRLVKVADGDFVDLLPPSVHLQTLQADHDGNPERLFVTLRVRHQDAGDFEPDTLLQTTFVSRVGE